MQDFKSMQEVYDHVEETAIVDLLKHAMSLDEKHMAALLPGDEGLYLPGCFEPTFYANRTYYPRSGILLNQNHHPNALDNEETSAIKRAIKGSHANLNASVPLRSLEQLTGENRLIEDIYDERMSMVASREQMRRIGRYLSMTPTVPANAVRMAIGITQSTVARMCRHSSGGHNQYQPHRLIRPEFRDLVDNDEYMHAFEQLLDEVQRFIDRDYWNYYTYRIRGTTLLVQKGLDWRIGQYYQNKFDREDAEQQDA